MLRGLVGWSSAQGKPQALASRPTHICCAMPAATRWRMRGTTRAPYKRISAIEISRTREGIRSSRQGASRGSGRTSAQKKPWRCGTRASLPGDQDLNPLPPMRVRPGALASSGDEARKPTSCGRLHIDLDQRGMLAAISETSLAIAGSSRCSTVAEAGNWRTVACCPSIRHVSSTISPSGNSKAS
jgi:hypothetical protein